MKLESYNPEDRIVKAVFLVDNNGTETIETEKGLVIFNSCCHGGTMNII